jgi:hypothetical protein
MREKRQVRAREQREGGGEGGREGGVEGDGEGEREGGGEGDGQGWREGGGGGAGAGGWNHGGGWWGQAKRVACFPKWTADRSPIADDESLPFRAFFIRIWRRPSTRGSWPLPSRE